MLFAVIAVSGIVYMNNITGDEVEELIIDSVDSLWETTASDDLKKKIAANEQAVVKAMKQYVETQEAYKKDNNRYAKDFRLLDIPLEMQDARPENNRSKGYFGYYFMHVLMNGSAEMDYKKDFVLCGAPRLYRSTGLSTFAIGPKGIIIYKDNKGNRAYNATEFADGTWRTK